MSVDELVDIAWDPVKRDFQVSAGGDFRLVRATDVVRGDLLARLTSPPASHWAHPGDGVDLTRFVQAGAASDDDLTLIELRQDAEIEAERHALVQAASGAITARDLAGGTLTLTVTLSDGSELGINVPVGGSGG